jgi:hypothetical protein
MMSDRRINLLSPFLAIAGALGVLISSPGLARDGVTSCLIAEAETEAGKVWRHKLEVQVPEGENCRIYIIDDKDRKSWLYCSLQRSVANPVSETCDDPLDDKDYDAWMAKAVCDGRSLMASCRREVPLQPGQRSSD